MISPSRPNWKAPYLLSPERAQSSVELNSYFTNFPAAEAPISEGGAWHHSATPWATIKTISGPPKRAVGTQTGNNGTDDSYALLSGFGPNISAQATIYKDPAIAGDLQGSHEVEFLFRAVDTSTTIRCYECNLAHNGGYQEIVRWNGAIGSFTVLSHVTSFPGGTMPPVTGDTFKATIVGGVITVYIDKHGGSGFQQLSTFTDSTYTDGNPGIGMWLSNAGGGPFDPLTFGFTDCLIQQL